LAQVCKPLNRSDSTIFATRLDQVMSRFWLEKNLVDSESKD